MLKNGSASIASRLTWMNMLVSSSVLLLASAGFVTYEVVTFSSTMVRELSIQAQIAGYNSISSLVFNDPASARNTLAALKAAPHIIDAEIYTSNGNGFAGYSRDQNRETRPLPAVPRGQVESHWFTRKTLVLVRQINFRGRPEGMILIRSDLRGIDARLKSYAVILAIVLGICFIAGLFLSFAFRRVIAEPIVRLAGIARIISRQKDYTVRIASSGHHGELGILMEAFNEMLVQIQKRDEALQRSGAELERRVEERTAQLKATNKELEAFCLSVSHDLRAPLRAIDGFCRLLIKDYENKLDEEGQRRLGRVRSAAQRMGQLIDDLLALSRVTRTEMQCASVDLTETAREVLSELQGLDRNRTVDVELANGLTAQGDPRLLRQVLENLLANAWKYTSKTPTARIEMGTCGGQDGKRVYFVKDNGAGFDMAYAGKLFGVFQRLHTDAEFPGTGVGLATVQRIIHRHRGEIWAEASVGNGATFYFSLP
jgi:signal transduction histidine kinase